MYVAIVPNRKSPPAVLLRESYRQNGRVKSRTLANLSHWPKDQVERLRAVLRNDPDNSVAAFEISRSLPHGHVAAALGVVRKLDLLRVISRSDPQIAALCVAMIVARILMPGSKLSTARMITQATCCCSLGDELGLGEVDEEDLYRAMDKLVEQQDRIEAVLAKRHLEEGSLVLYDVSSTWFEGRSCRLAKLGYSRDGRSDRPQIVFGLLTNREGCPVAIEVFEGNTADPKTVRSQIEKLQKRFGLKRIVLVGDRGMITEARIREDLRGVDGIDWVTALRGPAIRSLVEDGAVQLSLFDEKDLAEITSPDYPNERLIVCRNPLLADERARKRLEMLAATERELERIRQASLRERNPLRGVEKIALRVGRVAQRFKMKKHFVLTIEPDRFEYQRTESSIRAEAAFDGIYAIRTSLASAVMDAESVVRTYKRLSSVERAFRSLKTVDLKVRPIFHRQDNRVRAHVFLCMLAYYVEWHMRRLLAPILFDDETPDEGERLRKSIVSPARRSPGAERKAQTKTTLEGFPVHSFQSLLKDLATITKNTIQPLDSPNYFVMHTRPTPIQKKALDLVGAKITTKAP